MRRDRIIAGTSTVLSFLIGVWLVLQWTKEQPVTVKTFEALKSQEQAAVEAVIKPHHQAFILPLAPVAPAPKAQAGPAPSPKPEPIKALVAPKPAPENVEPGIEPLKPSSKLAPKPVIKAVLKITQPIRKPAPVTPAKAAELEPLELDVEAFRDARKETPRPNNSEALIHFTAQRAAQKQIEKRARPAPATPAKIDASAKAATFGRVALRILEHGEGPEIEIAWPYSARASNRLYRHFSACYGMKTAVMDGSGRLYTAAGGARPWHINLDRYSGFVRQVSGRLSPEEASELSALQRLRNSKVFPVRIFPRSVDARLLHGLGQLLGKSYQTKRRIRASYRMTGLGVSIGQISADGKTIAGEIILQPVTRRCAA